jgi:hypothetical protein
MYAAESNHRDGKIAGSHIYSASNCGLLPVAVFHQFINTSVSKPAYRFSRGLASRHQLPLTAWASSSDGDKRQQRIQLLR